MHANTSSSAHSSRQAALLSRHSSRAEELEEALKSPSTSDFYLKQLKKEKLLLKDKAQGII